MVAWTVGLDEQLKALRAAGQTWEQVSAKLFVRDVSEPADRPARPSGHPLTWGLITAGTVLDGAVYPYPVFL